MFGFHKRKKKSKWKKTPFDKWVHDMYLFSIGNFKDNYVPTTTPEEFAALVDGKKIVFVSDEEMYNFHSLLERLDALEFDSVDATALSNVYPLVSASAYKRLIKDEILNLMAVSDSDAGPNRSGRSVTKAHFVVEKKTIINGVQYVSDNNKVHPMLYGARKGLRDFVRDKLYFKKGQ